MNDVFCANERFLRAVRPPKKRELYWKGNRLSSAVFKDRQGLSVDRTGDRDIKTSVDFMRNRLEGFIFSISIDDCKSVNAHPVYCPSKSDIYHSEIHGSSSEIELSEFQALYFAENAKCEYSPNM